jgi:hypothetical protein
MKCFFFAFDVAMNKRLLNALPAGIALVQNARTPHKD